MARKTAFHNLEIEMAVARKTQNELANILGITPTTLSLKLNGKSDLSLRECVSIKKALQSDKSVDFLFAETIKPEIVGRR